MATDMDTLSKALNFFGTRQFTLKPEVAVRALLDGKCVLAVLATGCHQWQSFIYQMIIRAKDYQMNGKATINLMFFLRCLALEKIRYKT